MIDTLDHLIIAVEDLDKAEANYTKIFGMPAVWRGEHKELGTTNSLFNFKNTYFEEVYNTLRKKFKLGRVRILLKEPRSTLSWHRDPEPRLHIPIVTNPGCRMVIENIAQHMPADGTVTITNNTKYHNFFNGGEQERIHLVACVLENPFKNHGN